MALLLAYAFTIWFTIILEYNPSIYKNKVYCRKVFMPHMHVLCLFNLLIATSGHLKWLTWHGGLCKHTQQRSHRRKLPTHAILRTYPCHRGHEAVYTYYNCVAIAIINTSHNMNTLLNSTKCLSPHLEKMRMLNLKISKVINVTKFYHFNAHKKILFFLHYPICSEKLQDTGDCWPATTFYPNPHHCKIIFRNYSSFYCKDGIWHK